MHDGAVIIRNNKIVAARAILPLTRAEHVSRHLGTRHRAALGVSEESDAVTIVVSEESGFISLAYRGIFHRDLSPEELEDMLEQLVVMKDDGELNETVQMIEEQESAPIQEEKEEKANE